MATTSTPHEATSLPQSVSRTDADIQLDRTDDLLFAVPKKGRLYEKCLKVRLVLCFLTGRVKIKQRTWQLMEGAGIKFNRENRLDLAPSTNMPVSLVFLPAADIAKYVGEGNIDMGITGLGALCSWRGDPHPSALNRHGP